MKLKGFKISNYKSIKDSGYCDISSDITILAGKNESGKSVILEALSCFNINANIPDDARPIGDVYSGSDWRRKTVIACLFEIDDSTIKKISNNIELNKKFIAYLKKNPIVVFKDGEGSYRLDKKTVNILNKVFQANKKTVEKIKELIGKINKFLINYNNYNDDALEIIGAFVRMSKAPINKNISNINSKLDKSIYETNDLKNIQESIDKFIKEIKTYYYSIEESKKPEIEGYIKELEKRALSMQIETPKDKLLSVIKEFIPYFIYHGNFDEILPYEIPLKEDGINEGIVRNFANIAEFNTEELSKIPETQRKRNVLATSSKEITEKFNKLYNQDSLNINVELNGDKLCFGIKESENPNIFKPEQRSKGFQWFLSLFLELIDDSLLYNNVILIDEPDLHLHASAQEDVLKILESLSEQGNQIVISTHSPFLMEPNKLERIRIVEKDKNKGTTINNKFWIKSGLETLTPIHKAIGLDLTKAFSVVGKKNVLFEGITDYLYFQGLKSLIKNSHDEDDICFIPCAGADTIKNIVPLLIGWDLKFVIVYDNDKEGNRAAKKLIKKYPFYNLKIIHIPPDKNDSSIEDLFTHDEFISFIPSDIQRNIKTINPIMSNSEFIKTVNIDKIILAQFFLNQARKNKIALSYTTINNFKNIFKKIAEFIAVIG